jgi:hypothetical protein
MISSPKSAYVITGNDGSTFVVSGSAQEIEEIMQALERKYERENPSAPDGTFWHSEFLCDLPEFLWP